jgi:hypothetical protein
MITPVFHITAMQTLCFYTKATSKPEIRISILMHLVQPNIITIYQQNNKVLAH